MSEETSDDARRKVLKGAAVGLAAMASAGHSKAEASPAQGKAAVPLMDPGKLHTAGPFRSQPQPWPGLASHMTPRPDHGEKTYRGSGRMAGRKALVTGGDSGLGRATAIAFAREGADVAISYLPQEEEDAREVIQLIQAEGRKAVALSGDIRTEPFCQKLVADAVSGLGGLDCLVNCAGRQHYHESILDLTTEDFDWTLKTNLYALFWIIKAAIPHMPPGSSIVNTSSSNAYEPSEILVDYSITKAGIANLTKSLAKQLVSKGIRVNAVAPGPFWTALQVCGGQPMSAVEKFGSTVPMKRPGQPAEIAPIYVQLASTDGSYITGQVFGVTGGTGVPG
ncbi:dehydrogenase [Gluconobacter thailandicus]|uniref:SDR family oxidoreductase n=1 Tax=Gluconobacter thailandicus TaxID=257438 RepID=UPI0007774A53|nr:SDR family oxidoreductase [Gluconobacter thailandicus]KXV33555.1 dehydrogenase [Gluconobacter thailandicus]